MLKLVNALGCRVIRGKDWEWEDEDGGLNHAGTVIGLGRSDHKRSPAGTVEVCWDWGLRSNYRAGFQGKYDLRVIDTAQCGIIHIFVWCDSCKIENIRGFRFECTVCENYNLCTRCYHDGDHDLEHQFLRFDQYKDACKGVKLTPRLKEENQIEVRGIFKGATVVKRNWDWVWQFYHKGEVETYHNDVACDACKSCPILGARYKCMDCHSCDLCTDCYQNGRHQLNHSFTRFKSDQIRFPVPGEELTARQLEEVHWKWTIQAKDTITYCDSCKKSSLDLHYLNESSVDRQIICEKCFSQCTTPNLFVTVNYTGAIFSGLRVLAQNDWKWTNTDASYGVRGFLNCIFDASKTGRSLAFVKWTDTKKNDYRVGDKGKMDLKYVKAATGGIYYENHLPTLDLGQDSIKDSIISLESIEDSSISHESANHERLRELESKVEAFEEQSTCSICMEARKDVVFHCGHSVCSGCSTTLHKCHICRKNITGRIKLY